MSMKGCNFCCQLLLIYRYNYLIFKDIKEAQLKLRYGQKLHPLNWDRLLGVPLSCIPFTEYIY